MNQNTNDSMKKLTPYITIIVILLIGTVIVSKAHTSSNGSAISVDGISTSSPLITSSSTTAFVGISGASRTTSSTSITKLSTTPKNKTFTSNGWSLGFTLRPEWNVNESLNGDPSKGNAVLHQITISSSNTVIFISQNEAVAVSDDLASTTSTQTIAGQSATVRIYIQPNTQFAFYKIFTIKESDGTYSFLIKSATADTTITDAFIKSITHL